MSEELVSELSAEDALVELGFALGRNHAFGLIAGRCSAAQAEGIRRLREEKQYKKCCETWEEFCPNYLRMSRGEADRTIRILEEFGPAYFELSQLTRVSPEAFRTIAPAIYDGALHVDDEAIELNSENSRKVAAAVAELRRAIPKKDRTPELQQLVDQMRAGIRDMAMEERIAGLHRCCTAVIEEFREISRQDLGMSRMALHSSLTWVYDELGRIAMETGLK